MRNILIWLGCSVIFIWSINVNGQGTVLFNNAANNDPSGLATQNGLVFINFGSGFVLLNQDINFQFLAGTNAQYLQVLHTWLVSDGSANGISLGGGHFADPTGTAFTIPGVPAGGRAVIGIFAWAGNYPTWDAATLVGAPSGQEFFSQFTSGPGLPPTGLTSMPAWGVSTLDVPIPEPTSATLCIVSLCLTVISRRFFARSKE